jgi:CysZ protein
LIPGAGASTIDREKAVIMQPPPQSPAPAPVPRPESTDPLDRGALRRFLFGFGAPWRGLRLLFTHPRLLLQIIVPAALNMALVLLVVAAALIWAPELVGTFWERPAGVGFGDMLLTGMWLAGVAFVALFLIALGVICIYGVAGLVLTPFLDYLSERVEELTLGPRPEGFAWPVFFRQVSVSIWHSLLNFALYLAVMGLLLLLNLIPAAGQALFMAGSSVASAFFLAREMLDGPLTRDRLRWTDKYRVVWRHKAVTMGLGAATAAMLWIPLLNFICLPVAVTGGTLLYAHLRRTGRLPLNS